MYVRTRLTLWFVLILALVLGIFSVVIHQLTRSNLLGEIERDVRQRAAAIAQGAPAQTDRLDASELPKLDVFAAPDTFLQLVDRDGKVLTVSGNLGSRRLPFMPASIAADRVEEARLGNVPLFLYGKPIADGSQVQGYVLVARSPRTIYQALNRLQSILYPGVAIALLLGGLVAWLLVRRAMRPLEELAATASSIASTGDHRRRVRVRRARRGPGDETNRLAATINGMLDSLESAYKEVKEVNDTQRRFLADISHELRTPLTIMLSSLDLISKVKDPEFQTNALADMRAEADRMARLVTQLLMLARTDASTSISREPILLGDLVADACRQARSTANGVALECCAAEALEGTVISGNPDYLKQMFLVLLDNAFKYTPPGGSVKVDGVINGSFVSVTVADTGIGIESEDLPKVFDRFYRAQNARGKPGMGLGLAIAQSIAEQHTGKIEVESEPGRSSRFTVILPILNRI
jgi:two-component system, OmpR family, sensor kinase